MAIENTVFSDFDPRSSIIKSVFDCRLSSVCMIPMVYTLHPFFNKNFVRKKVKMFLSILRRQTNLISHFRRRHLRLLYVNIGTLYNLNYVGVIISYIITSEM